MSDSYLPDNEPRDILWSLEELAARKLSHAPTFRKAADEIRKLRAALRPFADRYAYTQKYCPDREHMTIGLEDLRAAAAAIRSDGMSDEETAPEMLSRLGTNGMLWAQEFNKTAVRLGYSEMDEGWLVGWFANAIENCDVIRCNPLRAENEKLRAALKPFAECLALWAEDDDLGHELVGVPVAELRAAAAALKDKSDG